jgi:hypothetical protein
LRDKGIDFLPLDGERLSEMLKRVPVIVYDFFGIRGSSDSVARKPPDRSRSV